MHCAKYLRMASLPGLPEIITAPADNDRVATSSKALVVIVVFMKFHPRYAHLCRAPSNLHQKEALEMPSC